MSLQLHSLLSLIGLRKTQHFVPPNKLKCTKKYIFSILNDENDREAICASAQTIQLLTCYNFLCVHLSVRPSTIAKFHFQKKHVYFETKAYKMLPAKKKCVQGTTGTYISVVFLLFTKTHLLHHRTTMRPIVSCTLLVSCT